MNIKQFCRIYEAINPGIVKLMLSDNRDDNLIAKELVLKLGLSVQEVNEIRKLMYHKDSIGSNDEEFGNPWIIK